MTHSTTAAQPRRPVRFGSSWLLSEYLVLALAVLLFLALAPFTPRLASSATGLNILSHLLPLLVVAIGMTAVMITGGIDLSVTAIIGITSVAGAQLMTQDGHAFGTVPGVAAMLLLGAALGGVNGFVITMLRLPPFIVTLASMMFLGGFAVWWTQSKNIYNLPQTFLNLGGQLAQGLTITVAVTVIAHLLLNRTVYGRWLYAVGQNAVTARISGVPVRSITMAAYVASGLCAAAASVLLTGRLETGSPIMGREMLLDIIGATVVGGTSLFGGKGKILWTFFGVLFLTILDNALNLLNLSHFSIMMVKGGVILLAATLDALRQRLRGP